MIDQLAAAILLNARYELNDIYIRHDVLAFRSYLKRHQLKIPQFTEISRATDEELSELMYKAKSQLQYMGATCQEARDRVRIKTMWGGEYDKNLPRCGSCVLFESPSGEKSWSCAHHGCLAEDIICHAYEPIEEAEKSG
jgi:hypothetical protein